RFIRWIVEEGDSVKKGDPICEVETDKVTMEVESFASGMVVKLLATPDSVIEASTVIAVLGDPGEEVGAPTEELSVKTLDKDRGGIAAEVCGNDIPVVQKKGETVLTLGVKTDDGIIATPLVRNIARKMKVDLANIQGTGRGGLITKQDLEKYIQTSKGGGVSRKR
ncbi:MAG: E3 binding domain-containing protein, partial [Spirochaetota bacterium]